MVVLLLPARRHAYLQSSCRGHISLPVGYQHTCGVLTASIKLQCGNTGTVTAVLQSICQFSAPSQQKLSQYVVIATSELSIHERHSYLGSILHKSGFCTAANELMEAAGKRVLCALELLLFKLT